MIGIDPLNEPFALIDYKVSGPNWRNDLVTRQGRTGAGAAAVLCRCREAGPANVRPKPILFLEPHLYVDTGVKKAA